MSRRGGVGGAGGDSKNSRPSVYVSCRCFAAKGEPDQDVIFPCTPTSKAELDPSNQRLFRPSSGRSHAKCATCCFMEVGESWL